MVPSGLTASARDAAIQKEVFGSGRPSVLAKQTISNEKMGDIIQTVKFLEKSGLLMQNNKKMDFLACY